MVDFKEGVGIRNQIREHLKNGATHTELALGFLAHDPNIGINHNHTIVNPDAVLSSFVVEYPELSLKNRKILEKASHMSWDAKDIDHKSYSVWAIVNSHLYYPEISGSHISNHVTYDKAKIHIRKNIYPGIKAVLEDNLTKKHITYINKFSEMVTNHMIKINQISGEIDNRMKALIKKGENINEIKKRFSENGYVPLILKKDEKIDISLLNLIAETDEKIYLVITAIAKSRLKVALRSTGGKLTSTLYNTLNTEEKELRNTNDFDPWHGTELAGGSPIDGTMIGLDRLSKIFASYPQN